MVTYKQVTEFFEEVVLNEGRTDVQNHVGFMNIYNNTAQELAENAFGGKLIQPPYFDISQYEKILYIYVDEDEDYLRFAGDNFSWNDRHHFQVLDASGQRVLCWVVGMRN